MTGAGSGIGRAIALRFAADGTAVAVADQDGSGAKAVANEIGQRGGRAIAQILDVRDGKQVATAIAATQSEFGGLHVLVTSAGLSRSAKLLDMQRDDWDLVIGVNLTGTFVCTRAAAPGMVAQGWGRIIHIASTAAQRGISYRSAYCASKGGVVSFMQACAMELAETGVTVNAISPGPVESPMTQRNHTPAIREAIARVTPMRRYGQPEEIAAAAVYLASAEAGYVTGQQLSIDGGFQAAGILYDDG